MAINKNFIVKNGLEVNDVLIYANPNTERVGIGTSIVNYKLHVRGGIGATDLYISGITTLSGITTTGSDLYVGGDLYVADDLVLDEITVRNVNVTGLGTVFNLTSTNGTITNLTGTAGTITTFNSTNGTITNLTGTAGTITTFNSTNGTITNLTGTAGTITTFNSTNGTITNLTGTAGTITTFNSTNGTITNLTGTAGTITTFNSTNGTITNINSSGISTLGIVTASQLYVSGISTLGIVTASQLYVSGISTLGIVTASQLYVSGVSTFGGNLNIKGLGDDSIIEHANASVGDLYLLSKRGTFIRTNNGEASGYFRADGAVELYYDNSKKFETTGAGVTVYGTLESQQLNVTGIATASSFKGSSQVGIATAGGYLGLTTQFKFVGSGVTITSEYDSNVGITTLTFIGSSGGGGGGTPGGSTGEIQYNNSGSFGGVSNFTYNGTDLNFVGIITATSFVKSGGTSSQFLKADGSVDTSTYLTSYSETSTLNDVLTRGNVSGIGISVGISTFSGNVFVGSGVVITSNDISVAGIVTATDFNSTSDQNLKTNIQTVHNALGIVEHLRGVRFDWKKDHKPSLGVIAQELEEVLPELVSDTDPKTVNYNGLIGVLIEAIKELSEEVQELKSQLNN